MIKRIYIEITNQCNLRCSFCDFHHREIKEMNLDEFEIILKEIQPITSFIYLHVQGEPFCHSQWDKILNLCENYNMKVHIVTNGLLLPETLSYSCIRKVSISIHSIDEHNYDTKLYINRILQCIKKNNSKFYIDLRFWVIDRLKEKSKFCLDYLKKEFEFEITKKKQSYRIYENTFVSFAYSFEWPDTANNEVKQGTCKGAKNMLAILSDGQVTICCLDNHGSIHLGNIFETSLKQILASSYYQSIINGFNENKCIAQLCQKCTYRNRFR